MAAALPDGKAAEIKCSRVATIATSLKIRYGKSLTRRNLQWTVTDQRVGDPLLGGPMLEAFGLNTRDTLAAAAARYNGTVEASKLLKSSPDVANGRVSRVKESIYREDGGDDELPTATV